MEILGIVGCVLASLIVGIAIGRYLLRNLLKQQEIAAQAKAKKILKDAENNAEILKKNRLLEAKEKFLQMKAEHEQQVNSRNNEVAQRENSIKQKEQSLNSKLENANRKEQELDKQKDNLEKQTALAVKKQEEVDLIKNQHVRQLETIAGLSAEEAKNQLVENMKAEARSQALMQVKDIVDEAKETIDKIHDSVGKGLHTSDGEEYTEEIAKKDLTNLFTDKHIFIKTTTFCKIIVIS